MDRHGALHRRQHIFQNMGDGTYAHWAAWRSATRPRPGVNITFKLLSNSHTSMTGGQAIQGRPSR